MATTSPDNLRTPNPGDSYNLVPDLATLANDVQAALLTRSARFGTAAQRAAFLSTAPVGFIWQDTDDIGMIWKRGASTWVPAVWRWSGSASQMDGFTQAPNGFEWLDSATQISYCKVATGWMPFGGSWSLDVNMGGSVITAPTNTEVLVRNLGTGRTTPANSKFRLAAYNLGLYGATGVELKWRYSSNGTTPTTASPQIPFNGLKRLTGLSGNVTTYDFLASFTQPSSANINFGLFMKGAPTGAGNIYFDNWTLSVSPGS